jgi:hypothetical protein
VREETQLDICVYCKQPITRHQLPAMRLSPTERAHVTCYLDHDDAEQKKTSGQE